MKPERTAKSFRTALRAMALGLGLVGVAATAQAHDWKRGHGWGPPGVVVVPAAPVRYVASAPVVVATPVMYAPAPVMYAPAPVMYAPAYAAPGSLSIGLNVPLR